MDELKKEVEEWTTSPTMRAAVIMTVETLKNCNEQFLTTDEDRRQHDLVCALTDVDILNITRMFEKVMEKMCELSEDEFQQQLVKFIIYFISQQPSENI